MNAPFSRGPLSILVVEDETLVALNLESMLEDMGHSVVGPVMTLGDLDERIDAGLAIDVAILDVNVAGEYVFPQARRLAELGVPILFATGYGESGLSEEFAGWSVVSKPYSEADIARGLASICV